MAPDDPETCKLKRQVIDLLTHQPPDTQQTVVKWHLDNFNKHSYLESVQLGGIHITGLLQVRILTW